MRKLLVYLLGRRDGDIGPWLLHGNSCGNTASG